MLVHLSNVDPGKKTDGTMVTQKPKHPIFYLLQSHSKPISMTKEGTNSEDLILRLSVTMYAIFSHRRFSFLLNVKLFLCDNLLDVTNHNV